MKQKPGLYVGRRIQFSVCDGYATYDIDEIRPAVAPDFVGEVVVTNIFDGSDYEFEGAFENLRGELVIPLPVVQRNIGWADKY